MPINEAEMPQSEEIRIRTAKPNDLETIVRFNIALALESERLELDEGVVRLGVAAAFSDPARGAYYLAERNGRIVGQMMITLEWSDWRNAWYWWIQSVFVEPAYRRTGVFRALHGHIRELARREGNVCGLRLYVHNENEQAGSTYDRLGMPLAPYLLREDSWTFPAGR